MVPKALPRVTIQEDLEEEQEEELPYIIKNTFLDFDVPAPSTIQYSKSTPAPASSMPVVSDSILSPNTRGSNTKEYMAEGDENNGKAVGSGGGQAAKDRKKALENKKGGKRFNNQQGLRSMNHGYRGYAGDAEQAHYLPYGGEVQNPDYAYYAAAAQVATNAAVANAAAAEYYNVQAYNAQAYNTQAYPSYQMSMAHYDGSYAQPVQQAAGTGGYKPKGQQKNKGQKGQGKEQQAKGVKATGTASSTKAGKKQQPDAAEGPKSADAEEGGTKYQCTFWIGIEDESLELSKKILGPRGKTFKYIGNVARGTRLRLRGRGSSPNAPNDEPLHLRIISSQLANFNIAKEKVTELLTQIYAQHEKDTGEKLAINCVEGADNPTNA